MTLAERRRKVDVEKLSIDEADQLSEQIGTRTREICDDAANKINAILNIYGLQAKIAIAIEPLCKQEDKQS
jgi:hypothetical protein